MTKNQHLFMLELIQATLNTHQVDETGDATLVRYLEEVALCKDLKDTSASEMLESYLIWANGPDWRTKDGISAFNPERALDQQVVTDGLRMNRDALLGYVKDYPNSQIAQAQLVRVDRILAKMGAC